MCDDSASYKDAPDAQPLRVLGARGVKKVIEEVKVSPPARARPSGKLAGWGVMFEVCTEEDSNLGQASADYDGVEVRRVTKAMDWSSPTSVEQLIKDA